MAWQQLFKQNGNFAVCAAFDDGRLYMGGYGDGAIYAYPPLEQVLSGTGEAILGMVNFKGTLFATCENNDAEGYRAHIYKQVAGGWSRLEVESHAALFCCVWGDYLVVTTSHEGPPTYQYIDVWLSSDGSSFSHIAKLSDWLWVPAVYRTELYLLGHAGAAGTDGGSKAVKLTNTGFVTVAALTGVSGIKEWQCAAVHSDLLFLGGGGWTIARDTTTLARVFSFDGTLCTLSKHVPDYSEIGAICSHSGTLYASAASGYKYTSGYATPGNSQVWKSTDNGVTWSLDNTFGCPQLYALVSTDQGLYAAGGGNGYVEAYLMASSTPSPTESLDAPTDITLTLTGGESKTATVSWTASESAQVTAYAIYVSYSTSLDARTVKPRFIQWVQSPTTSYSFAPGNQKADVRLWVSVRAMSVRRLKSADYSVMPTYFAISDFSEYSNSVIVAKTGGFDPPLYLAGLTPAPGDIEGTIRLDFPYSDQYPESYIELAYRLSLNTQLTTLATVAPVSGATDGSYTFDAPVSGASILFYARYKKVGVDPTVGYYSDYTVCAVPIVVPGPYATPTNVTANFETARSVRVTWQDESVGEAIFEVDRWRSTDSTWAKIVELAAGTETFTDNDVNNGILVQYRVRARSAGIYSEYGYSDYAPKPPASFSITKTSYDVLTYEAVIDFSGAGWTRYYDYPTIVDVQTSVDQSVWLTLQSFNADSATETAVTVMMPGMQLYYVRLRAANGAGETFSNAVVVDVVPDFYTVPNVPVYEPGSSKGWTVVVGKDGSGELDQSFTGVTRHEGYLYAANTESIGTLDASLSTAELTTQPVGDFWFGDKTVMSVELEATANRDIIVTVGSRADYKDRFFDQGKEVALHKSGRTGYTKEGREFEVTFKWRSGSGYDFFAWGGRLWLKVIGMQGFQTLPDFYGKYGYYKKGGK